MKQEELDSYEAKVRDRIALLQKEIKTSEAQCAEFKKRHPVIARVTSWVAIVSYYLTPDVWFWNAEHWIIKIRARFNL